jgi:acetate kinase
MKSSDSRIVTVNAGSSSIKVTLFDAGDSLTRIFDGGIERIGLSNAVFRMKGDNPADNFSRVVVAPDYAAASGILMDWLEERIGHSAMTAVGHRVVQGGPHYSEPQRITEAMIAELHKPGSFDPEHLPEEIGLIEVFYRRFPDVPQVACFDTAFHHDMPRVAQILPIPRRYEAHGVRRYGFHGLSYSFLMEELARVAGSQATQGRIILAHLGSGASLAAVHGGKSIDTSMGFTPAGGIPMSMRSGDLDPGLIWYLAQTEKMTAKIFNEMTNSKSGLLGVSETSSDMHDLLEYEGKDVRAAEAVALFCYRVKKEIGAFAAALGGVDTLIFAGGIGENSSVIRSRICEGLAFLGIEIEEKKNAANAAVISLETAPVSVRVIHTDEAWTIAQSVRRILTNETKK